MSTIMADASGVLKLSPVIPVVTIEDPADAVPLARALLAGGIGVIELTLRTPTALTSMRLIADEVPDIVVGAGTILTPGQADGAVAAGAQFLVSPGATPALLTAMNSLEVPVLPGVATVGEVLMVLDHGLTAMKFFPAGPAGGPAYLAAISALIPHVTFCPTGGISLATAHDYLRLVNVSCVGGSWLTPADAVVAKDWTRVEELAAGAAALG
ncbi:KHG/KDPG aldolase [Arthrobacter ulcerisalmonis]|uniref:2-dehydro-3-deoxy-phosphogluconate aldolase n=2 Tax=Arthrobacter ulcerisalmonis TaxID=2483813 RepID=A0A3P5WQ78_9MICC|nr:KHG/KDPG aldolase [Arthrobacter ulcerisalmonis]